MTEPSPTGTPTAVFTETVDKQKKELAPFFGPSTFRNRWRPCNSIRGGVEVREA